MARAPSTDRKHLVVVVHGLGDDEPGTALRSLARSLAAATGGEREPVEEVLWLPESDDRQVELFPCHVERLREGGTETVLAETYWADLSRLGKGALHLLFGVFRLLLGFHQLIRQAADPARSGEAARDRVAAAFRALCLAGAYLLRGPAAAGILVWLPLWVAAVTGSATPETAAIRPDDLVRGLLTAISLIAVAVGVGMFRLQAGSDRALALWLALVGGACLLLSILSWTHPWLLARMGVPAASLHRPAELFASLLADAPLLGAFVLAVLAVPLWLVARVRAAPVLRPGLDLVQAVSFLGLGLWGLFIQFLVLAVSGALPEGNEEVQQRTEVVASLMTLYWLFALIVVASAIVTLVRYLRWVKGSRAATYDANRPVPRLLVGGGIVAALISVPLLVFVVFWMSDLRSWLLERMRGPAFVATLAVPLVVTAAVHISDRLHQLVDFLLDLITHFELRKSPADAEPAFVRRARIQTRLRTVLEVLIEREEPARVTLVTHSQGTIVTLETLAGDDAAALLAPLESCDLVTMGSPFHHFYQHYFANAYPALSDMRWNGLRQRISRWCNLFRIDDYVGTAIEPGGDWPENIPVDPGGHTGYWSDRQILAALRERELV